MWSLRLQPSVMRRQLILACAAVTACTAAWVFWRSLQTWWLDWLWCWPLLLVSAFCCWRQSSQPQHGDTLCLSEQGRGYYVSDTQQRLQLKQGLLTPFVVFVQFSCEQQPLPWRWLYRDQLDDAAWARLRRVCLNCQQQGVKPYGPGQRP
ncbi:hypothetical protein CWE12_02980 [Aliidiomarina sedimenti]|uniref:Toxin CptA n=1 Tax=Aliidiomarina sedimenti TaxID=1933879 RepID=A0ABY0C2F6_9GAMM|nr:protein YgfX [Aliidiomarina sedimenti]RUO31972.1 hypothetical protein CWE12_02980 [Aliidiomarina sedimenti]